MDRFITTMERRIDYLTSESRRMFGLLAEKKYVHMVLTYISTLPSLLRLRLSLSSILVSDILAAAVIVIRPAAQCEGVGRQN